MSVAFEEGKLNGNQSLPIANKGVRKLVEELVNAPNIPLDKKFVYYLLGSTGICVVPLSSFSTPIQGFRITLLEPNDAEFCRIFDTIATSIEQYLAS